MKQFLVFMLLCAGLSAAAQTGRISGVVTDEQGDPLPYASITIQGTSKGVSANAAGAYAFDLAPGKYKLQARYVGFKQTVYEVTITERAQLHHDFKMSMQAYVLKDVIIKATDEDPAYRIIRNAIKQRTFHLQQTKSFQASIYMKGVFRNRTVPKKIMGVSVDNESKTEMGLDTAGKGILYLSEQVSDFYAQGNKERLIVRSVKESGDPNGFGIGSVPPVVNFYENNVRVLNVNESGQSFLSPIANGALSGYKYKLLGEFEENGQTIYKISVTPKRDFERCFFGNIFISEGDWAIHSTDLMLTNRQGLDLLDTIGTKQLFLKTDKDVWVIKTQILYPTIKFFGFDIAGSFVAVYDKQKVNEPIPDTIFNKKIALSYLPDAVHSKDEFWKDLRPMELQADEQTNYVFKDSLYKVQNDPARIDSLRKRGNKFVATGMLLGGYTYNSKKSRFSVTPIVFDLNFNPVEGLNYSPVLSRSQTVDTGKTLYTELGLRYGFSNTHFNAKALIRYRVQDKHLSQRMIQFAAAGGKFISQFNTLQPVNELLNTYTALIEQKNYFNIYERTFGSVRIDASSGTGWSAGVQGIFEQRDPLNNTTDFSFTAKSSRKPFADNFPTDLSAFTFTAHKAFNVGGYVSFRPGSRYIQYPNKKVMLSGDGPLFTLAYTKGISGVAGSITNFDKWRFSVTDELGLKRLGSLEYMVACGGFLNSTNVQVPDLNHLYGNRFVLASPYLRSFQTAPYYRYSNAKSIYGELHVEYYLKGLLTNKLPLLRQAHWYLLFGNNTFYADQNNFVTEAFVGIDNLGYKILRFLRIDYVHGWDAAKNNYQGIRIGLHGLGIRVNADSKANIF